MHPILLRDNSCNAPQLFYTCSSNKFAGCCSVDPCNLPGCPDSSSASIAGISSSPPGPPTSSTTGGSTSVTGGLQSATQPESTSQPPSSSSLSTSQLQPTTSQTVSPLASSSQSLSTTASGSSQAPVTVLVTSEVFITPTRYVLSRAPVPSSKSHVELQDLFRERKASFCSNNVSDNSSYLTKK